MQRYAHAVRTQDDTTVVLWCGRSVDLAADGGRVLAVRPPRTSTYLPGPGRRRACPDCAAAFTFAATG